MGDQILQSILNDVSLGLQSPSWKEKYAALMILGSVLAGPTKEFAVANITGALPTLMQNF